VAHCAVKCRDSKFRAFYLRVRARHGAKVAVVALARKMLTIIHHLLVNGERYVEEGCQKIVRSRRLFGESVCFEDMAVVLRNAGYIVRGPFG
jgi:transposase